MEPRPPPWLTVPCSKLPPGVGSPQPVLWAVVHDSRTPPPVRLECPLTVAPVLDVQLLHVPTIETVPSGLVPVRMSWSTGLLGTWFPSSSRAIVASASGQVVFKAPVTP